MPGRALGKTEVVTRRLAWLIATKRALPREILALTFTDNAAEEMQSRVDILVPYGQADAAIHTFHAFGDQLLREFAFELGLAGDVRLISRAEAIVLLRENLFDLGLDRYRPLGDPTRFLGALIDLFQRAKDEGVSAELLTTHALSLEAIHGPESDLASSQTELAQAYEKYQELLATHGVIDHGDQIWLPVRLLREHDSIRDIVSGRYRYLLVDEFQDMNPAQLQFVNLLTGTGRNVTVVGDPDQAIYTFRGATADNVVSFAARHPDTGRVVLRRNYRSRQPIVDAAHRLISHALGPELDRERQISVRRARGAAPVRSVSFATPEAEADGVAAAIAEAIAAGAAPRDFAVLARSNSEIDALARAMRVRDIPVRTHLPSDFFAQPAVRPLLAFLRVIADPDQTLELYALATGYPYELGGAQLIELLNLARRRHRSLWQILHAAAQDSVDWPADFRAGSARLIRHVTDAVELSHQRSSTEVLYDYLSRSGRLARLAEAADPAEARAVARFFEIVRARARLLAHDRVPMLVPHLDELIETHDEFADSGPLDLDAVSVLTVHRAKGLEFKVVYLTGLNDGRFPARGRRAILDIPWDEIHGQATVNSQQLEEERRLCYVAMTRARDELRLTHHLSGPGARGRRRPSPFVAEALDAPTSTAPVDLDSMARIEAFGRDASAVEVPLERSTATEFSFSELETYIDCPERYRLRHVIGLPQSPHHALAYGSAMHQAVAAYHLSQRRGEPMSEAELLDVFARAWSPEGFLSREHEEQRYAAGQEALRKFRADQLDKPAHVAAVERPFVFALDELRIRGRMDRIDRTPEGVVIVDYKSSDVRDQKKADERARDSLQLQVYAMAHEAEHGELPHEVQLHFLDSRVVGAARPDAVRLDKTRDKLRSASTGIRAGSFEPRPSAITCGYCPFRQICSSSAA